MGFPYGIDIARNALIKLSTGITFHDRISDALSELEVIEKDDVTEEHFNRIRELEKMFSERNQVSVNPSGDLESNDVNILQRQIVEKIVWLAVDICETNTRLHKEDE